MIIKKFYGFIALTVVLLATTLTYFCNSRMNDISVINTSNVEALSESNDTRFILNEHCLIDTQLNTVVLFDGVNKIVDGVVVNTCEANGGGCILQLESMTEESASQTKSWLESIGAAATTISNVINIIKTVGGFLKNI